MYNQNSDQKSHDGVPTSPRISFSNNLVESIANANNHHHHHQMMMMKNDRPHHISPAVSSDFEFSSSVTIGSVMSGADELFSDGKILPFKQGSSSSKSTLRDKLLVDHDDEDEGEDEANFSLKPPKSSAKWKGFLGLRKSHIGSKKVEQQESPENIGFKG